MNSHIKLSIIIILAMTGCRKEMVNNNNNNPSAPNPGHHLSLTLTEAKQFINQLKTDSSTALAKIKINWEMATTTTVRDGNKWTISLPGQPIYQGYKQGYRELVILKNNETQQPEAKILEIIPDAIYLQKKRKTRASDFTGRVFEYDLNYKLTGGRLYSNGKAIGSIQKLTETQSTEYPNQGLKDLNPFSGAQGKIMRMMAIETCVWMQDSYTDANGDFTVHSFQVCSTNYFDDGGGGGGGYYNGVGSGNPGSSTGGGGGSSGTTTPPAPSNLPGEEKNAVNPREMMECFSNIPSVNAAFVVRVYVVEPQPGTSFNVGANSFGHVAISLSKTSGQNTITQTVGFYPTGTGLEKLSSKSQIIDNGDMEYNMSATYYVTAESFQKVIDFVSTPSKNYHFTDYNCSAFVYGAGQAAGIAIPNPTTQIGLSGPGGAGYAKTPAGMASALREQKANNHNLDINEGGGRVPGSNGPCNIK